jgi:hypothetical protein
MSANRRGSREGKEGVFAWRRTSVRKVVVDGGATKKKKKVRGSYQ